MSNRKTTLFYALLIAIVSLAVGMVIASRLGMSPESSAQTTGLPPQNNKPLGGPVDATTFRTIAKAVSPAVVNIRTESRQRTQDLSDFFGGGGGGGDDLFDRFFGGGGGGGGQRRPQQPRERDDIAVAAGTGFIIDKAGFILTNNHVIEGATKIEVSLYGEDDDQVYKARVIGRDPLTDSALIELIEKPNHALPEIKFGDSSQMEPGDWVMAIGQPFGLGHTVSVGVISAVKRSQPVADQRFQDFLQTDAAINPGNSGGPLLNLRGEVVGINTAIFTDSRQSGNIGIGFAMPINIVRELLPQLRTGKVTRGRIGVAVSPVPASAVQELGLGTRRGTLVSSVSKGGPADKAGVQPGDVIIEFNGKPLKDNSELVAIVGATKPGTTVPMKVMRDKQQKTLNITLEELDIEQESTRSSRGDNGGGGGQEQTTKGFGLTLGNITPELARRMRLDTDVRGAVILDVEPGSTAQRVPLTQGDIILQVNRKPVSNATQASEELNKVRSGSNASLLILRGGVETFVIVPKE
jgi:serine protease Do